MTKNLSDIVKRRTQGARPSGTSADGVLSQMMGTATAPLDIARPIADLLLREIDLDRIKLDPTQPRKTYSEAALAELAESITNEGLIQAIGVFWSDKEDAYIVYYGERRFRAARLAGLTAIPAVIWPEKTDDVDLAFKRMVENEQREPIPAIEAAQAIQELMDRAQLSQREIAKKLAKSPMYVSELLSILKIEPKLLAKAKDLPKNALVQIARAKDPTEQKRLFKVALSSDKPHTVVKQERAKAKAEHGPRDVRRYVVDGKPVTVTVTIDKEPDQVTTQEVIEALTWVVQKLAAEEMSRLGEGPPHA